MLFDGVQKCCTNDQCTAYVSSGVTITGPSNPTGTGSVVTVPTTRKPTTTNSGSETTLAASFEYYYFTITWYVHFQPSTKFISSFQKAKTEEIPPIHQTVSVRPISQN